jgi:hypothetical protein
MAPTPRLPKRIMQALVQSDRTCAMTDKKTYIESPLAQRRQRQRKTRDAGTRRREKRTNNNALPVNITNNGVIHR